MAPSTKRKFSDHTDNLSASRHKTLRSTSILETPPPTGHRAQKAAPAPSKASKSRGNLSPTPLTKTKPTTLKLRAQPTPKTSRKARIAADPINISIYELRKQGLDWTDIAIRANEECKLDSEHELSGPACYSRFKRNGPLVAEARGEPYQKEWYLHMSGKVEFVRAEEDEETEVEETEWEKQVEVGDATEMGLEAEIVKTVEHERAQFWANVTEVINAKMDSRALTEEEVKIMYDRLKGNEV